MSNNIKLKDRQMGETTNTLRALSEIELLLLLEENLRLYADGMISDGDALEWLQLLIELTDGIGQISNDFALMAKNTIMAGIDKHDGIMLLADDIRIVFDDIIGINELMELRNKIKRGIRR